MATRTALLAAALRGEPGVRAVGAAARHTGACGPRHLPVPYPAGADAHGLPRVRREPGERDLRAQLLDCAACLASAVSQMNATCGHSSWTAPRDTSSTRSRTRRLNWMLAFLLLLMCRSVRAESKCLGEFTEL
jgi:hypothetical protein